MPDNGKVLVLLHHYPVSTLGTAGQFLDCGLPYGSRQMYNTYIRLSGAHAGDVGIHVFMSWFYFSQGIKLPQKMQPLGHQQERWSIDIEVCHHFGLSLVLTLQKYPSASGHTSVRFSCLSCGPVGPLEYLAVASMPKISSCLGSESGYRSSPQ